MLKKRKKSTLFHVKKLQKKLANALVKTNQLIGFDQVFQSINCNQLIAMHLIANAIFRIPGIKDLSSPSSIKIFDLKATFCPSR